MNDLSNIKFNSGGIQSHFTKYESIVDDLAEYEYHIDENIQKIDLDRSIKHLPFYTVFKQALIQQPRNITLQKWKELAIKAFIAENPSGYLVRKTSGLNAAINRKEIDCGFCGSKHVKGKCRAYGKTCTYCKKLNHFARVCKKKQRATDNRSNGETRTPSNSNSMTSVTTQSSILNALVDTGCVIANVAVNYDYDTDSSSLPALVTDSESESSDSDYYTDISEFDSDTDESYTISDEEMDCLRRHSKPIDNWADTEDVTEGPVYLDEGILAMAVSTSLAQYSQEYFLIDTGASNNHIRDSKQFQEYQPTYRKSCEGIAGGNVVQEGIGKVNIYPLDDILTCEHNPNLNTRCGVLSMGMLEANGWSLIITKDRKQLVKKDKQVEVWKMFNTYYIGNQDQLYAAVKDKLSGFKIKPQDVGYWHRLLGCLSIEGLRKIDPTLKVREINCNVCAKAKGKVHIKHPHLPLEKFQNFKELAEKAIFLDFKVQNGPYNILINLFKGYVTPVAINGKNVQETITAVSKFIDRMSATHKIEFVIADLDSGFKSKDFEDMVNQRGLRLVYTPPRHHSMNLAERYIQTFMGIKRAIMHDVDEKLLTKYEPYLIDYCGILHNARPSAEDAETPWKRINGSTFPYKVLHKFGTKCLIPTLEPVSTNRDRKIECIFLGYKDTLYWNGIFLNQETGKTNIRSIKDAEGWEDISQNVHLLIREDAGNDAAEEDEQILEPINDDNQIIYEDGAVAVSAIEDHDNMIHAWMADALQKRILIDSDNADDDSPIDTDVAQSVDIFTMEPEWRSTDEIKPTIPINPINEGKINHKEKNNKELFAALVKATEINKAWQLLRTSKCTRKQFTKAIKKELKMLLRMGTLRLVSVKDWMDIIGSQFILSIKRDGRHKARCVARGDMQREMQLQETYSPTVTASIINIITRIASQNKWGIWTCDVTGAYLNGRMEKEVYMSAPFPLKLPPGKCFALNTNLYGLKPAGKTWYTELKTTMEKLGLKASKIDQSLFYKIDLYVAVHVDDLFISGTDQEIDQLLKELGKIYELTINKVTRDQSQDYLGMQVSMRKEGYKLCFGNYIRNLAEKFGIKSDSNSPVTPMSPGKTLLLSEEPIDITAYRSMLGSISYTRGIRPDICFTLQQLSSVAHCPGDDAWKAMKRCCRYLVGTADLGLLFKWNSDNTLYGKSDASWANCPDTQRSVGGHVLLMGGTPVLFTSKRQNIVADSSAYSEFIQLNNMARDAIFVHNVLEELQVEYHPKPIELLTDNSAAEYLSVKNQSGKRSRHFDVAYAFIRQYVGTLISIGRISTDENPADIFTKSLSKDKFLKFRKELMDN